MMRRDMLGLMRIVLASCLLLLGLDGRVSYAHSQSLDEADASVILREEAILLNDSLFANFAASLHP